MVTLWGNYEGISQSKAWIYRLISQGRFPKQVKIGSRAIAFVESEIDEWIEKCILESRDEVA
ncbi:AlpA family phage regulatory protein [Escherichia coli]|nr:AlpA family phage regulatory protein [Escherichia coli]